jgi:RND superfamily putative drug exporter
MARSGNGSGPKPVEQTLIYRTAMFGVRNRRLVVGLWILATIASLPFFLTLNKRLSNGGFEVPGSQSDQVRIALETEFAGQSDLTALVVFTSETKTVNDPEYAAVIERVLDLVTKVDHVSGAASPFQAPDQLISADERTATSVVNIDGTQDDALEIAPDLEAAVAEGSEGSDDVRALITGAPSFYRAFQDITQHDLERAESIAFPISLIILVLAFGSLVAAGMPLIMAIMSLLISFGLIALFASLTEVNVFAQNLASMIGIGVGIDYSLFILARFRSELRTGLSVGEAVAEAVATSGKAVLVSGLTVVVALSGVLLVNIQAYRTMGVGAMIAVAVAALAAVTLLPALLGWVGPRVNKFSIHRRGRRDQEEGRYWHRWAMAVMRRPWTALVASLAILLFLAWPARNLALGSSGPSILPEDALPRQAFEIAAEAFGEGQGEPTVILLETAELPTTAAGFAEVAAVSTAAAADPEVRQVASIATLLPPGVTPEQAAQTPEGRAVLGQFVSTDGRLTLVQAVTQHSAQSEEVHELVRRLRESLPGVVGEGTTLAVGGQPGLDVDLTDEMGNKLVPVVGLVLLLSFLVLMLFFRSLLLPLKAILMNLASVLAAYGVLVFVFQEGHWEGLLGFTASGHIEAFLPLFLFTTLFGLSMDYEVFLLARIREEYLRTGDNTEAVGWGLEHTARIITSAAAIMVVVFGAFAFASLVPIKAMGFGLAIAVFLDATIIRTILVPSTMRLMGDWNWWLPKWLDRALPNVSLEGSTRDRARAPEPSQAVPS